MLFKSELFPELLHILISQAVYDRVRDWRQHSIRNRQKEAQDGLRGGGRLQVGQGSCESEQHYNHQMRDACGQGFGPSFLGGDLQNHESKKIRVH